MSKVAIVTDSSPNIPQEYIDQYQIHIVPLNVIWDDETYTDGVDITANEFYKRLSESETMPSTSQPSAAIFKETFERLHKKGYQILAILIADKLSGTIASAMQAREELAGAEIEIVDSLSTSMATGLQVLAAAKAAQNGHTLNQCAKIARQARDQSGVIFILDTLEFLHRGGRIGSAKRFVGTLLAVKPILAIEDGEVISIDQVRTHKRALAKIVDILEERTKTAASLRIACLHANDKETASKILNKAKESLSPQQTIFAELSPVLGTHAGPGAVGLAYLTDM
ncbi:MAG: DegV family protein [Anaerolineales bacterium]|nr:DegV family protein [Anaerolineales bacterium]MBS3752763.1 DegV family protein [Anaerolineales bacterium]